MDVVQGLISNVYLDRPQPEVEKGRAVANREIQGMVHDIILIPPKKFRAVGAVQAERQFVAAQHDIRGHNGFVAGGVIFNCPERVNERSKHKEDQEGVENTE
jgi:hypothetical protein